ncbi:MAG: biotin--[acetyl-CoA-carboxylase] ligase [Desulfobulbaceae bacterium A2]|nr:MAG: biotin--[acetyl-CoA-carboxylase] ligase [Desulfobulbaceae bacterium A2]
MGVGAAGRLAPAMLLPLVSLEQSFRLARGHSPEDVAAALRHGAPLGRLIEHHDCLTRCMDRLGHLIADYEAADDCLPCGVVVVADRLRRGRGRFDRDWHAPDGGAWLALAWSDCLLPAQARLLPLAAGVACCETLRDCGVDACIKWVNDVHVGGRKIAGILSETLRGPRRGDITHCLGIGVNVNNTDFPGELRETATSLRLVSGGGTDLDLLRLRLLVKLRWNIGLLHLDEARSLAAGLEEGGSEDESLVLRAWRGLSDTVGRRVEYGFDVQRSPDYQATALGVDACGGLVLALDDGGRITEYGGEIRYLD